MFCKGFGDLHVDDDDHTMQQSPVRRGRDRNAKEDSLADDDADDSVRDLLPHIYSHEKEEKRHLIWIQRSKVK